MLSTTEVGNRFFAVSTSLTQANPNSKKGLRRKGEDKEDKEERKAQSKLKCPYAIQTDSDRSKSRFSRFCSHCEATSRKIRTMQYGIHWKALLLSNFFLFHMNPDRCGYT
ncbi:hypothetical protein K435DRAFT_969379 [Dendrothele bispora CBS 962.96]|uniref:Uncharacterized protein n=1 Tax=Dendrothele bispora (strain CBS 962.96) TaxID=1314807 RepID=A0A4S8LHZ5_DENBC|nr:hypothetical protein K435DRAFT_969379 [Dendrothele bispora CBS 962.96]